MQYDRLTYRPAVALFPFLFILLIWGVYYLDWYYFLDWKSLGILPRQWSGLKGILFSPLLHGSIEHLWSNTTAMALLLPLMIFYYRKNWLRIFFWGWFFSGLGTWLIADRGIHIGASGIIYVLVAYLFFSGLLSKHYRLMAISFVVVLLYGGAVWFMFPEMKEGISWQGHLAGFLTGSVLAFVLDLPNYAPRYRYEWQDPNFDEQSDPFIRQFDKNGQFNPLPLLTKDAQGFVYNQSYRKKFPAKGHRKLGRVFF